MPIVNMEELTDLEKKILCYLLDHVIASPYELSKNLGYSYSTLHDSTNKLATFNMLTQKYVKSSKGGPKKLYSLSDEGKKLFLCKKSPTLLDDEEKESTPKPLDVVMIDFLLSQKRESAEIDFKLTLDTTKESASFPKICKDIFAMSNYGGGYLLFGFLEIKGVFDPVGIPDNFDFEQARVQEKFNSYSNEPIVLDYRVVSRSINGLEKKFAIMYIPPSPIILFPKKDGTYIGEDGKQRKAFAINDILVRRGSQSVPASASEIAFIKKRAQETDYKIGLLKGKPDRVSENLFGNFFEVTDKPEIIYEAKLPENIKFEHLEIKETPFIRQWPDTIYSFYDISLPPVGKYIQKSSLCKHAFSAFLDSPERRNIVKRLLDSELKRSAINIGLRFDKIDRNVYYYPSEFQDKIISWEGRSRKSNRFVVRKLFLQQENTAIFIHSAASLSFRFLGNEVCLEILPKIVLTFDGVNPIDSSRGGPIKTRLTYNQFNDAYLNHVLFWASRFKTGNVLRLQFGKHLFVCSQPVIVTLDVGIKSDRPSLEFSRRRDELYSVEDLEVF